MYEVCSFVAIQNITNMDTVASQRGNENVQRLSLVRNSLAGGIGGACDVLVTYPLDTLKVRLQAMPSGSAGTTGIVYKGALDCLMTTIRREGFLGLYRGITAPLAMAMPSNAVNFSTFSLAKRFQAENLEDDLSLSQIFKAGMFNGVCMAVMVAPTERIKCTLQVQNSLGSRVPKYRGPVDCAGQLYRRYGISGVYRGFCGTVLREIPGGGTWFLTYESFLRAMSDPGESRDEAGTISVVVAGGLAGMAFWTVVLPFDVLKTRYQTAPEGTYPRGVRDVFRCLIREEGPKALYRGFVPTLFRAAPSSASLFLGYETSMKLMNLRSSS